MDAVPREFAAYVGQIARSSPRRPRRCSRRVTDPEEHGQHRRLPPDDRPDRKQELLEGDDVRGPAAAAARDAHPGERVPRHRERHRRPRARQHRAPAAPGVPARAAEGAARGAGRGGRRGQRAGAYLKQLEEKKLPEAAAAALTKEIKRLGDLPPFSAEVAVAKTYLDTRAGPAVGHALRLGAPDVAAVARVLDETHYGLEDVKDRIIEYLAVAQLRGGTPPNTILCLVGPPGVGKTSVAMAIAQGLGPAAAAHQPGRRARRGRDPRAPAHLRGRHARPHHRRAQAGRRGRPGDPARRDRQDGVRLAGRPGGGAHGGARPGAEPAPSGTTTWSSSTTSRTCSSSPRPTTRRTSPRRCTTGWRSSGSRATPDHEKEQIAAPPPHPQARRRERAGRPGRRLHPAGAAPSSRSTPARPGCASWPGSSARSTGELARVRVEGKPLPRARRARRRSNGCWCRRRSCRRGWRTSPWWA